MRFAFALPCLLFALSAQAAESPAADPCRDDNVQAVQRRFGYIDDAGEQRMPFQAGCKPLPDAPTTAAMAVFHRAGPYFPADEPSDDGIYDLHLLLVDADGKVLAQLREQGAADSDAVRLDSVDIDTARYHLAPGVRAFGVSTTNATHCYACAYYSTKFGLFMRQGATLRRVLGGLELGTAVSEDEDDHCVGASMQTTRTLALGRGKHAGYADLVVTTATTHEPGFIQDSEQACGGGADEAKQSETWVYDGARYQPRHRAADQ